jgi:hypothetical protein
MGMYLDIYIYIYISTVAQSISCFFSAVAVAMLV